MGGAAPAAAVLYSSKATGISRNRRGSNKIKTEKQQQNNNKKQQHQ